MAIQCTYAKAKDVVTEVLKARQVPLLTGSPGCAKSALFKAIAKENGLKLIDVRLAQCDPTDLLGFPAVNETTGKACYRPMETFPIVGDPIPKGYNGWLVLLDELTSAKEAIQAASYKLVLDRQHGMHDLHEMVFMGAAGNLETDGAIVEEMSTALESRFTHLEMKIDNGQWLDWASSAGLDHRILDYIKFKPDNLYTFKPDHTDKTYACPRTWEKANAYTMPYQEITSERLEILAGTISEGVTRQFIAFCQVYKSLPKIGDILAAPESLAVSQEPSVMWAVTGMIGNAATMQTMDTLMKYISRFPVEFQILTLRDALRRKKELKGTASMVTWVAKYGDLLFS